MSLFSYSFPGFTLGFSNSNAKNFYNYIIFHHKNLGGQNILKAWYLVDKLGGAAYKSSHKNMKITRSDFASEF